MIHSHVKEERLRKGQNQLILEKWQKKYSGKRVASMSKTSNILLTIGYNKPSKTFFPKIIRQDIPTDVKEKRTTILYDIDGVLRDSTTDLLGREFTKTLRDFVEKKTISDDIEIEQVKDEKKETITYEIKQPETLTEILDLIEKNESKEEKDDFIEEKVDNAEPADNIKEKEQSDNKEILNDQSLEDTKSNLDEFEDIKIDPGCKTNANFYKTNSSPFYDVPSIMKRILEKNKKEINTRISEIPMPQSYMNLNKRPSSRAFIGSRGSRPMTDLNVNKFDTPNYMEVSLMDYLSWRKHEEIWINIVSPSYMPSELEKYLIPPNDFDILTSYYAKLHNATSTVILSDNTRNPREELNRWKHAFKKAVLRWHPDKLFPVLDGIKLIDENKRHVLKKKSSVIINNMNKLFKGIVEILKKISSKKEESIKQ
jgi:hypothetical protein